MVKVYDCDVVTDYDPTDHNIIITINTGYEDKDYTKIGKLGSATIYFLESCRPITHVSRFTKNELRMIIGKIEYLFSLDIFGIVKFYTSNSECQYNINQYGIIRMYIAVILSLLLLILLITRI